MSIIQQMLNQAHFILSPENDDTYLDLTSGIAGSNTSCTHELQGIDSFNLTETAIK
jgi:hypothetical protein